MLLIVFSAAENHRAAFKWKFSVGCNAVSPSAVNAIHKVRKGVIVLNLEEVFKQRNKPSLTIKTTRYFITGLFTPGKLNTFLFLSV